MREMILYQVGVDQFAQPVVLLKTKKGNTVLPIAIGYLEAEAIAMGQEGAAPPRPMTHDLLASMLSALDAEVTEIAISEVRDDTFYAFIGVTHSGVESAIDSRPSDAIALAVRVHAPMYAADDIVSAYGVALENEAASDPEIESELSEFRDFLRDVNPEDFAS